MLEFDSSGLITKTLLTPTRMNADASCNIRETAHSDNGITSPTRPKSTERFGATIFSERQNNIFYIVF